MKNTDERVSEILEEIDASKPGDIIKFKIHATSEKQREISDFVSNSSFLRTTEEMAKKISCIPSVGMEDMRGYISENNKILFSIPSDLTCIPDKLMGDQKYLDHVDSLIWDIVNSNESPGQSLVEIALSEESQKQQSILLTLEALCFHYAKCLEFTSISSEETRKIAKPGLNRQTYSLRDGESIAYMGVDKEGQIDLSLLDGVNISGGTTLKKMDAKFVERFIEDVENSFSRWQENSIFHCSEFSHTIKMLENAYEELTGLLWTENPYSDNSASTRLDDGSNIILSNNPGFIDNLCNNEWIKQTTTLKLAGHIMLNGQPVHIAVTECPSATTVKAYLSDDVPDMLPFMQKYFDGADNESWETWTSAYMKELDKLRNPLAENAFQNTILLELPQFSKENIGQAYRSLAFLKDSLPQETGFLSPHIYPHQFVKAPRANKLGTLDAIIAVSDMCKNEYDGCVAGPNIEKEFLSLLGRKPEITKVKSKGLELG